MKKSIVIAVIVLLALVVLAATRLLRGRISHTAAYYLWLLVLLRLVFPLGLPGTGLDLPQPHQSAAAELVVVHPAVFVG